MTLQTNNNITTTSHKRLSVQISLTGLSFFVEDRSDQSVLYAEETSFETAPSPEEILGVIQEYFQRETSLKSSFDSVVLIYATPLYTLIPQGLFDRDKASEYLKFNAKILPTDYIAVDKVSVHDSVVVYVPYVNINNYFFDKFGSFSYYHGITLLLTQCIKEARYEQQPKVIVQLMATSFDLLVFDQGNLILCNTYTYQTSEDFLYYLLFAFEQLQLNPDTIPTELIAPISETDERYELAYRYIRNISIKKLDINQLVHTIV